MRCSVQTMIVRSWNVLLCALLACGLLTLSFDAGTAHASEAPGKNECDRALILIPGYTLHEHDCVVYQNTILKMEDGMLALYASETQVWYAPVITRDGYAVMQGDGNLVIYSEGVPVWASHTDGYPGSCLLLGANGTMAISKGSTTVDGGGCSAVDLIWRTKSYTENPDELLREFVPCEDILLTGELGDVHGLAPGQCLSTPTGGTTLAMEQNGNLSLYHGKALIWENNKSDHRESTLQMQGDGNLVTYDRYGQPTWASGSAYYHGSCLKVEEWTIAIYARSPSGGACGDSGQKIWELQTSPS
ncbi:D-mannose binding lectin [Thermosporothrix hazakensis]|uniref:D-mannose binding lectin n=1 Tax=Thermosporothrix hazakensis TaxID=644383 RepID=A0A326UE72_THEHA|nr:hypothetical protein [Thermosporothrix hazakensis]PZW28075.1 D-mannose binding lectin [Thermosporothrix hazakensis]GCE51296.1 hypothetical protein KTH_61650 [Thermosporothrix hazakensis]